MPSPTGKTSDSRFGSRSRSKSKNRGRKCSPKKKRSPKCKRTSRSRSGKRSRSGNRSRSRYRKSSSERKSQGLSKEGKPKGCHKQKKTCEVAATKNLEFGGTKGVAILIILLPVIVYTLNLVCGKDSCSVMEFPPIPHWSYFFDLEATYIFFGWLLFQIILSLLPIGHLAEGQPLKSGEKLVYRCNGFHALLISISAFALGVYYEYPLTIVYNKFHKIQTTAFCFAVFLSIAVFIKARYTDCCKVAPGGNSGCLLYDFFVGHELNPFIGNFDLKFFFEMRPGLIGWVMLDFIFLLKAYEDTGTFPPALTMVTVFQTLYVADALFFECAVLTTMDIMCEGFGYMLIFGDLVWVPFLYCLQPRFLLNHPTDLRWEVMSGIGLLNLLGYYIFRSANSEKNEFRKNPFDPKLAHMEVIPTSCGKKLLVSGWWALCRKPNYFGDIFMALAWSLPCGLNLLPYFYPIYFVCLLVHRERRDSDNCQRKYGSSWDRYCERVKYRIFPCFY